MKTNKIMMAVLGIALLFTACKEDVPGRDVSPVQEGGTQAYIFENTKTSVTFLPADTKTFDIVIGRYMTEAADSVSLDVEDASGVLVLNDKLKFKAGIATDTIHVDASALAIGSPTTLTLSIPESQASVYGRTAIEISVLVDYTWEPRGLVNFTDELMESQISVAIEKAKESTDSLFRLKDVFYESAAAGYPDEAPSFAQRGYHLKFILDDKYQITKIIGNGSSANWSPTGWDPSFFGETGSMDMAYSSELINLYGGILTSVENNYVCYTVVFGEGGGFRFKIAWVWEEGFPGKLTNPTEGEGAFDFTFTTASTVAFNDSIVEGATTGAAWYEESTEEFGLYEFSLETAEGVTFSLALVDTAALAGQVIPEGIYSVAGLQDADNEIKTAVAGSFDGADRNGCYIRIAGSYFYLTSGTIEIAEDGGNYTITLDGESSMGIKLKGTYTGTLSAAPTAPPAPGRKNLKLIKKF